MCPPVADALSNGFGGEAEVVRLIEQQINARDLGPGDKLPTERELVEQSGKSRTVVRRSLARLEASGRIIRHVGRGTFVADAPISDIKARALSGASPSEIMAVRLMIEPATMPMVVLAARQADFDEIERCLQGGERNRGYEEFEQWDAAFHRSLAVATQNLLLVGMTELMNAARDQQLWGRMKRRSFTPERLEAYIRDHRAIANAVYERDGATAQAAMRQHLLRVRENLLGD